MRERLNSLVFFFTVSDGQLQTSENEEVVKQNSGHQVIKNQQKQPTKYKDSPQSNKSLLNLTVFVIFPLFYVSFFLIFSAVEILKKFFFYVVFRNRILSASKYNVKG